MLQNSFKTLVISTPVLGRTVPLGGTYMHGYKAIAYANGQESVIVILNILPFNCLKMKCDMNISAVSPGNQPTSDNSPKL